MRTTHTRSRLALAGGGVAILAIAALTGLGYAGDERPRSVPPPSASDVAALRTVAMDLAIRNGEPAPSQMEVVAGPRLAVVERLMGGAEVDTDQDVFVVALKGNFEANEARLPPGFRTPTGTNLVLVFDASTKALVDLSLLKNDPMLEEFGTPIVVDP